MSRRISFSSGVSLMLSAANVFYHDVNYLWGIVSQLLFYATPILYGPEMLRTSLRDELRLAVQHRLVAKDDLAQCGEWAREASFVRRNGS